MIDVILIIVLFGMLGLCLTGAWLTLEDRQREFMKRREEKERKRQ